MSRRANPAMVGTFVLGAVILAVLGVALFGSGRFFRKTCTFVCYFTGNVNGLSVGAPVKFKGVEIGSVQRISIRFQPEADEVRIPVIIELDEAKISHVGDRDSFSADAILTAVQSGLRAQLETQSLVTGLLFVQLDFFPRTPATMVAENSDIPEIPTVPTTLEQAQLAIKDIIARLDKVDFKELADSVGRLVNSATGAADAVQRFADSKQLQHALATLDETMDKFGKLADSAERDLGPLVHSFTTTSEHTQGTLAELEGTLKQARSVIAPDSPLAAELTRSLQELASAARSIRQLADFLQRDPAALVRGRDLKQ